MYRRSGTSADSARHLWEPRIWACTLGIVAATGSLAATLAETSTALIVPRSVHLIATSAAPEPPTPLMANDQGYVRVTTASQAIGCSITVELVACQTSSDDWPYRNNGRPAHTVSVGSGGQFHVVEGDLGALDGKIALSAKTYRAQGWIIVGDVDTITFTNDQTGHGMRVSQQNVQPF